MPWELPVAQRLVAEESSGGVWAGLRRQNFGPSGWLLGRLLGYFAAWLVTARLAGFELGRLGCWLSRRVVG